MNKAEFLNELSFCLQNMNDSEKNKFIIYYDEMISDYVENGMSEEDAVNKIGAPKKIAEELIGISYLNGLIFLLDELMRNIQRGKNINNDNLFMTIYSL